MATLTKQILDRRISVEEARAIVIARAEAERKKERTCWKVTSRKQKTYEQRFTEWAAA